MPANVKKQFVEDAQQLAAGAASETDRPRLGAVAEPDEGGSNLNGVKLWATNGTGAALRVVRARVPKTEGRRGGAVGRAADPSLQRSGTRRGPGGRRL